MDTMAIERKEQDKDDLTSYGGATSAITISDNGAHGDIFVSEFGGQAQSPMNKVTNFSINYDEDGGGGSPKAPHFGNSNLIVNGDQVQPLISQKAQKQRTVRFTDDAAFLQDNSGN